MGVNLEGLKLLRKELKEREADNILEEDIFKERKELF